MITSHRDGAVRQGIYKQCGDGKASTQDRRRDLSEESGSLDWRGPVLGHSQHSLPRLPGLWGAGGAGAGSACPGVPSDPFSTLCTVSIWDPLKST